MVTKIHVQIDNRGWDVELAGKPSHAEVQAAIKDIIDAYPIYTRKYISIVQHGLWYDKLRPVADGWLAASPVIRWGLYFIGVAMVGVGIWLNM